MPTSIRDIDQMLGDIDMIVETFGHFKSDLQSHRNQLLPVNSLPDEILVRIFNMVGLNSANGPEDVGPCHLAFSQVCHSWREIALTTPSLWTSPVFGWSAEASIEFVRRAHQMPLYVSLQVGTRHEHAEILRYILTHDSLLRELSITGDITCISELLECESEPQPHLTTLKLGSFSPTDEPPPSVSQMFQGNAPMLASVHVSGCSIDWHSSLLNSVTELIIDFEKTHWRMDLSNVLATLEHAPVLKSVYFKNAFSRRSFSQDLSLPNGPLRPACLRKIYLQDDVLCMVILLQHLILHPTSQISLNASHDRKPTDHGLDEMFAYMGTCPHLGQNPLSMAWKLYGYAAELHLSSLHTTEGNDGSISYTTILDVDGTLDAWPDIKDSFRRSTRFLPFHRIHGLNLTDQSFIIEDDGPEWDTLDSEDLLWAFGQMNDLRSLTLADCIVTQALAIMAVINETYKPVLPFPALQSLTVIHAHLENPVPERHQLTRYLANADQRSMPKAVVELIVQYIGGRQKAGLEGLRQIVLQDCEIGRKLRPTAAWIRDRFQVGSDRVELGVER
jgi:hypothetical protein